MGIKKAQTFTIFPVRFTTNPHTSMLKSAHNAPTPLMYEYLLVFAFRGGDSTGKMSNQKYVPSLLPITHDRQTILCKDTKRFHPIVFSLSFF